MKYYSAGGVSLLSAYLAMVDTNEDKELVSRLYRKYKKCLFNVCVSILRNHSDAEDAVQDTFMRMIDNLPRFRDVDSPQTQALCVVMARNVAKDILRRNSKTVFTTQEELDEYEADFDNENMAISNIGLEKLKTALKRLSKDDYDVILLSVKFRCTHSEMADILGITYQSARYRLRKARNNLLKELEDIEHEQFRNGA